MVRPIGRPFLLFNGLLLLVGSVLGMNGGRQHPVISEKMGKFGSDAFFKEFAKLMVYDPGWRDYHAQMMLSPLLWSLGLFGVVLMARQAGESRWTPLGFVAMAMAGVMWVVTYIYDGWVSPETGRALLAADNDTLRKAITQTFASGQWFTIRISLYAWLLLAFGTAAVCMGLIALARSYPRGPSKVQAWALAVLGLVLGVWSAVAWAAGAYQPGPMVSIWWMPAQIATQVFYLNLGITVVLHAFNVHERGRRSAPAPAAEATQPVPAA